MITKYVQITFTTDASDELLVELDNEMNDDASEFNYNTKAYFLVYTYPEDMTLTLTPTDGVISSEGSGDSDEKTEILEFVETNEASLSYPCYSLVSTTWLGTSLGAVSITGSKVTVATEGTGVLKVVYKAHFRRYALYLSTRDEDTYKVIILVEGES